MPRIGFNNSLFRTRRPSAQLTTEGTTMAELLDDVDWQGKVYSAGWTASRGGVLESTERPRATSSRPSGSPMPAT